MTSLRTILRSNRAAFVPATLGSVAVHVIAAASLFAALVPSCSNHEPIVRDAIEVSMVALPKSQRNVPDRFARTARATGADVRMDELPPVDQSDLVIRQQDVPVQGGNTEDALRERMITQMERDRLLDEMIDAPEGTVDRNRTSPDGQLDLDIAVLAAGAPGDPEYQRWVGQVMAILMPLFRPLVLDGSNLACLVNIQMDPETGEIIGWEVVSPSGVRAFDAAAERAVQDAGTLPLPPEKYLPLLTGGVGFRFVPPVIRTGMFLVTALLGWAVPAAAQSIVIEIPGAANVPLALPHPEVAAGSPADVAEQVWQAVRLDLEVSGYFEIQDPAGYVEKGGGVEPGQFDMRAWSLLRTTVLVKTRVLNAGDPGCDPGGSRMCADVYVYHVPSGDKLTSKRFRAPPASARHLGHAIANHVLLVTTGTKGWFGSRILAVGNRSGNKEIYVLDTDGYGVQPVTKNGAINLSPAWSPDATQIAWTSYKKANPDVYVKELGTGRTRTISNVKGVNTSADFAPDGRTLALARSVEGDSDLFLLDAGSGAQVRRLTTGGGIDVSPDFSPDGSRIAFASERSGGSQVYVMPAGGGDAQRVTFDGDFNVDPVIAPDGSKIAYVGRSQGGFDLYVCDPDGRNTVRLTQDMGDNEDPSWSPDSKYLVFSSTRAGKSDLWITTADGRHQTRITTTGGWTQPAWMPGGK